MAEVATEFSNPSTETSTVAAEPSRLGHHMHKNRLQEYAQRSGLSLPSYSTINEGEPHAPRFRGTILLDGMQFTSPYTFSHRKEAEQDVAKLTLEFISVKFKNEGSLNIRKDPAFCKLILNEYAAKLKKDRPSYTTSQQDGILPIFTTTVIFDGKTYVGFAGRSKREAEQNAACVVIDSILASSDTVTEMAQIIKTKGRLYATVNYNATAGNPALRSEMNGDDANAAIKGTEQMAAVTTGSLPTGSTSWVPYTSPWGEVAQSNQINYQIPSLGLPMPVVDSQTIIPRNKRKKSKKRKANQSKRRIVSELYLSFFPSIVLCWVYGSLVVISRSIREQVLLVILFLLMLPLSIRWRRTIGSFYDYLRCA